MKTLDQLKNEKKKNLAVVECQNGDYCYCRVEHALNFNIVAIFDGVEDNIISTLVLYTPLFRDYKYALITLLGNAGVSLTYHNTYFRLF